MTQQARTRDDILRDIQSAKSLQAQGALVTELDAFDRTAAARHSDDASIDWAATVAQERLAPALAHERSTHETDWLGEITASADEDWANKVTAEAALWFGRTSDEVKADREEFGEQMRGMARRTAGAYGERMEDAQKAFTDYATFLHNQHTGASGLDQVQQLVDSQENPKQTALPQDVFDNFAPPVHPINQGVSGTESSERAPLMQEIEQEGGGGSTETHHDTAPQPYTYAEVPPQEPNQMTGSISSPLFVPTVAINHGMDLDTFRRMASEEAEETEQGEVAKTTEYGDETNPYRGQAHEAASGLDQVQQVVDPHEVPKPTPLNPEVAFPWLLPEEEEKDEKSDTKTSAKTPAEMRAEHVARLVAKDDKDLTPTDRQEIQAYASTLFKTADEWTGSPYHGPGPANSPATTPIGTGGTHESGEAAGRADRQAGDAPTFADDSSSVPPAVQGYSEGYGSAETVGAGAQPGMLPPGAGGMSTGYQTHAASLQTEAKQVSCATCGKQDSHFNMQQRGNGSSVDYQCSTCAPTPTDPNKVRWQGSLQVSAAFTSPVEHGDAEFAKAYKYASKWTDGKRLVRQGSPSFEAGLYAGISDNPDAQAAWVARHQAATQRYDDRQYANRIALHASFTKKAVKAIQGVRVEGSYLRPMEGDDRWVKTAATTTDLDTMGPGVSPSATGQTPINGPGTPPLLQGGTDPARPGGPSPYNGAEPFGAPAVPAGGPTRGAPGLVDTTVGGPVDKAAHERLSPQSLAFRQRVQAARLATKTQN